MAITASDRSDKASDTHARVLLFPFTSWLSTRVAPVVLFADCIFPFALSVAVAVLAVAVLSRFSASDFARLSLRFAASRFSRVRLSRGGVPVVLSVGCVVS